MQRNGVAVSEIDQSYSLGKAIEAFARPEDRRKRRAAEQDYLNLVEYTPAPEPSELEIAEWRKANPDGLEAMWRSRQREFFEEKRHRQAADAAARLNELQGHQYARGLKDALQSGAAIANGRRGGLESPKAEIEASIWNDSWQFDARAGIARGGVPHIEIHDVTVRSCAGATEPEPPTRKPLKATHKQEVRNFIAGHKVCGARAVWKQALERFPGLAITLEYVIKLRGELGIKARPGRRAR